MPGNTFMLVGLGMLAFLLFVIVSIQQHLIVHLRGLIEQQRHAIFIYETEREMRMRLSREETK
jgi:hypothetical protein